MISLLGNDGRLNGDPVAALAATDGVEGYITRTQIMESDGEQERRIAGERVSAILAQQSENGNWRETIVDTAGNIGLLLDYHCPPDHRAIRSAADWLLEREETGDPACKGLFVELGDTDKRTARGRNLQKSYCSYHPLVAPDFCCGVNPITSSCCALEALFRIGEDISSDPRLARAVDRLLSLANAGSGLCAGRIRDVPAGNGLWNRADNTVFRRGVEENPGVTICAHFFFRAIAHSTELRHSPLTESALATWMLHQRQDGNFDTRYHQYNVYYAADTLRLYREFPQSRMMFEKLVPALLRRQRKGLWTMRGVWLHPTFAVVRSLWEFGFLGRRGSG